jgi:quinol monooxygenase YgiN
MITLVAKHTVRPENLDRFKALAHQMVGPTRKEPEPEIDVYRLVE